MEEKIKKVEEYIDELDNAIDKNEVERAKELQTEIIAVYEPEIESLKSELDNYSITQFDTSTPVDYIGDAILLKAKLQNYKLNLASGLYKPFQGVDGAVTVTQHVNQDVSTSVVINLEQTIHSILQLPESVLSDDEKEILSGKIASISAEKDREKRWEKVSGVLKWIADKGIQVGIAALPYITKMLEATS
jgi:hypothetical protein